MKILVLQLKRIGDLILTTPPLVALRQQFPNAHITLCVMDGCAGLLPAIPAVDEVLIIRRRGSNIALWTRLALRHFDVCLDYTGNDRSTLVSVLSKARRRVAFSWVRRSSHRAMFFNELVESSVRENHTVDHYLDLLRPLGIEPHQARGTPVTLCLTSESRERAAALLREAGVEGKYVVVHPGTARPEKYWEPERWAAVIEHLQGGLGIPCVITGSPEAFEQRHIAAIKALLRTPARDLSGKGDLLVLGALIERAALLLSMDSAPVHFGAAFRTPQISLYGQTNPFHWHPRHERAVTLLAGAAGPFSPRFVRKPLSDLSTQEVIDAIGSLL
jgi:predicted lipopolysaccharide heptosyltransferase III